MLSDQDIFDRATVKADEFAKQADVSLIGHSLFDMWLDQPGGMPLLNGQTVANLGLSGTSTRQYLDVVIKKGLIKHLGKTVFVFLGVNDILKEELYSPKQVCDWLAEILAGLKQIAPNSNYFLLETTPIDPVVHSNVNNQQIQELNAYFTEHTPSGFTYIPTYAQFADENGNLRQGLAHDGLHFTAEGYALLKSILEKHC